MKIKFTAEQKKVLAEKMKEARKYAGSERDMFIARTIGDVYDVELPIPEVIESIARTERVGVGEHVYFLAPDNITKKVNKLTTDCAVTQQRVTPKTRTEVEWTDLASEEVYVCLHEWLKADHNVLRFNAEAISEAMDRQEIYGALSLVDAGAVGEGNVITSASGAKFTFPDLVAMARSVAKYGRELVLITGGNVTTDVQLLNYDADKNQAVSIFDIVTKHIPIEELNVTIDGTEVTVIDPDVAYVVAVSDAKQNRSLIFARRRTDELNEMADTEYMDANKERVVVSSGNGMNIGNARKLAKGFVGFEEYSATSINDKTYSKYIRS
jgi:hypothetical protein